MAAFQVNLTISAGLSFRQEFTLANADKSPVNLTGASFTGAISKNERSINADLSTAAVPVYERIYFQCEVVNAEAGVYCIKLTPEQTSSEAMGVAGQGSIGMRRDLATRRISCGRTFSDTKVATRVAPMATPTC